VPRKGPEKKDGKMEALPAAAHRVLASLPEVLERRVAEELKARTVVAATVDGAHPEHAAHKDRDRE
jgi:hypothetical protein